MRISSISIIVNALLLGINYSLAKVGATVPILTDVIVGYSVIALLWAAYDLSTMEYRSKSKRLSDGKNKG